MSLASNVATALVQLSAESVAMDGVFRFHVPSFVDCTGPDFPPVWDEYYAVVSEWESWLLQEFVSSSSGVPSYGMEGRTWTMDAQVKGLGDKVADMSHDLLDKWFPFVNQAHGAGLDRVIKGNADAASLAGVCYYGLIQCLWSRALLLMSQPGGKQVLEGLQELRTAMAILGEDFRADYLDSSRWPVRSLDIQRTLQFGRITKVPAYRLENAPGTVMPNSMVPIKNFFQSRESLEDKVLTPRELHVAAFGTHIALTAEPVTMLRGSLPEWRVIGHWYLSACRWQDPLHHYHCRLNCEIMGECNFWEDPAHLGRRILKMVDLLAEGVGDGDPMGQKPASMASLLDLTSELYNSDPVLGASDLILCTVPLLCSALRAVALTPMIGLFSMLHYQKPRGDVGEWGMMHFAEMARDTSLNAFAVFNTLISDAASHQIGIRLPAVRPFGLYNFGYRAASMFPNPFATLHSHCGSYKHSVLVPRSWLHMETSFLQALSLFVDAVEPTYPLNFTVVRSSKHGDINVAINAHPSGSRRLSDILRGPENVFIEASSVLLYRAAVYLPQQAYTMSLFEMHTMHLPMFLPGRDWLYRLYHQARFATGYFEETPEGNRLMQPPMFDTRIWQSFFNDTLVSWLILYDRRFHLELPGIQLFHTFPELLYKLLHMDMDGLRELMRKHNEETFKPILGWYRTATLSLMKVA